MPRQGAILVEVLTSPDPQRRRATLFSLVHRGNAGDVTFYRERCRGASSILEIGCGYGRLLVALADLDARLVGVDIDAGMLAAAREELDAKNFGKVRLVHADMRSLDLGERFERILVPYNALFALRTDEDVVAALVALRHHLSVGGELLFDLYQDDGGDVGGDEFEHLLTILSEGHRVEVSDRERVMAAPRSFAIEYRYLIWPPGGGQSEVFVDVIQHHYLTAEILRALVTTAGFELTGLWGDFQEGALEPTSTLMVGVARLAAD